MTILSVNPPQKVMGFINVNNNIEVRLNLIVDVVL